MNISGLWLPDVIYNVHMIYIYFQADDEYYELKEILYLLGTGLFESAYIRYVALIPRLEYVARQHNYLNTDIFTDLLNTKDSLNRFLKQ